MSEAIYPIRVVSGRTGLKADLIRMWERRYGAVKPHRTDTGRRLYSEEDISRLQLLRQALDCGWRIGDVSGRSDSELADIISGQEPTGSEAMSTPAAISKHGAGQSYLQECLDAVSGLNIGLMETLLTEAEQELGLAGVLDNLIAPLLVEIGQRWHRREITLSHEHMVSAALRHHLDTLRTRHQPGPDSLTLLSTTPSGQNHELGALMTATTAAAAGWNSVYMNPGTPAADIAWAADALNVQAIALSIVFPANDAILYSELSHLATLLPAEIYLLLGGSAATQVYDTLLNSRPRCVCLDSQRDLQKYLAGIQRIAATD